MKMVWYVASFIIFCAVIRINAPTTVHYKALWANAGLQNLALGKPTAAKPEYRAHLPPSNVVDGGLNPFLSQESCYLGKNNDPAYVSVDLMAISYISYVRVLNRAGSYWRLEGAQVGIANQFPSTPNDTIKICGEAENAEVTSGGWWTEECNCVGQYVIVNLPTNATLHFCELEVYGKPAWTLKMQEVENASSGAGWISEVVDLEAHDPSVGLLICSKACFQKHCQEMSYTKTDDVMQCELRFN